LVLGTLETVVVPDETASSISSREERIASYVRDWIDRAEARVQAP
jgi:hypothetical protein